ncbi:MAG: hypothetical protein PF569_05320 [Candidatus Woesearchaeota archaeon]|jgi:predicted RecB family endonuclease|nr:hypothetical protein [Candidatus Woesearchaeota archaeon]
MGTDIINISRDDLYKLIREAVRDELNEVVNVSDKEQLELEELYDESLNSEDYDKSNCIRL